jgi:hypothetical protein
MPPRGTEDAVTGRAGGSGYDQAQDHIGPQVRTSLKAGGFRREESRARIKSDLKPAPHDFHLWLAAYRTAPRKTSSVVGNPEHSVWQEAQFGQSQFRNLEHKARGSTRR